jgi:hypothetical protein
LHDPDVRVAVVAAGHLSTTVLQAETHLERGVDQGNAVTRIIHLRPTE